MTGTDRKRHSIRAGPKPWGGGAPRSGGGAGTAAPLAPPSAPRAATSPSLRDGEDGSLLVIADLIGDPLAPAPDEWIPAQARDGLGTFAFPLSRQSAFKGRTWRRGPPLPFNLSQPPPPP